MSELGHFQTLAGLKPMSASPQLTDIAQRPRDVGKVPTSDISFEMNEAAN